VWRVLTWNLDWWKKNPPQRSPQSLLDQVRADVTALQEVRGAAVRTLERSHDGPALFSQELHPEASMRWMGCALLMPPATIILEAGLIEELPKPQRSLWARIDLPEQGEITVVSWHTPNAAGDGREVKMAAYETMTSWLDQAPRPLVLGADLNTWRDPVDLLAVEPDDDFYHEHAFVGPDPPHGLVDADRAVLMRRGELDRLRSARPDGPLAVSHVLDSGAEHRMDRIYVSPDLTPVVGDYLYGDAVEAGSDHALHWIDLEDVASTA
jgi:exonuclease III